MAYPTQVKPSSGLHLFRLFDLIVSTNSSLAYSILISVYCEHYSAGRIYPLAPLPTTCEEGRVNRIRVLPKSCGLLPIDDT